MNEIPPAARIVSLAVAVVSAVALLANHFLVTTQSTASMALLCFAPIAMFLGIGGAIEPKIVWAMGKYGEHLPVKYKIIGGALGLAGLGLTFLLAFFVYRFGQ